MDALLRIAANSAAIGTALILPNALIGLEKPLEILDKGLDKRARDREARRIIYYAKERGLLTGDYEHGLEITDKGTKRLKDREITGVVIKSPSEWDHLWRLVFYDIPEAHKSGRDKLTAKLRDLGFFQMQRSVWIHPFPSRDVIEHITSTYGLARYVSYVETLHIDNEQVLIKRFQKRLSETKFH